MCGFGGILRRDGEAIPDEWLDAIDARIAYRGPDGEGRFRDRATDPDGRIVEIALVHRRLAILDIEGGAQPMVSEQRSEVRGHPSGPNGEPPTSDLVAVVFNGCIYNHRSLRAELESKGHAFATNHSDTEVLLHGYREWGSSLPEFLEGMYAFAIWDRSRASLTLARDWFGEKPLHVRMNIGGNANIVAFASDARSIASLNVQTSKRPNVQSEVADSRVDQGSEDVTELDAKRAGSKLQHDLDVWTFGRLDVSAPTAWTQRYLQLGYNFAGLTVYSGSDDRVRNLPPSITQHINQLMPARPREQYSQRDIEDLIEQAVERRLESDVPLGCFLSGGVDSSLIAHFASQRIPGLRTFTVKMPDSRYDESHHAEMVAEHLVTQHRTLEVAIDPAADLVHLIHTLGQPFGDSSILPAYWVSKAAREAGIKVALSGDGGDELFLGYERYMAARALWRHRRLLQWIPRRWLRSAHPKSFRHKVGRLGAMARDLKRCGILAMESLFTQHEIYELMGGLPHEPARQPIRPLPQGPKDPMQALRKADLISYLPDDLLCKVDTASMAVALEVRAPFLDRDLVTAVLSCPTYQLAPSGRRKGLLREIARKYLPDEILDRPKMGFAIPIGEWLREDFGGMRTLLLELLDEDEPFGPIELRSEAVQRIVEEHLTGEYDHGQRLFALLTLAVWARMDEHG